TMGQSQCKPNEGTDARGGKRCDPAVPNLRSHRRRSRTLAVVLTLKQPTRFRPSLNSPFLAKQFWNCPPESIYGKSDQGGKYYR
ncbi:hypothetical protein S83_047717, partial [Arachis hypogaea]